MSVYVPADVRRQVYRRAQGVCKYRLALEDDIGLDHQVEHIISVKHGGRTIVENLGLACTFCNRFKGSDIATLVVGTNQLIGLYHPRTQRWSEHFRTDGPRVQGLTDVGRATALLLCMNLFDRLHERLPLSQAGLYPSEAARQIAGLY